MKKRTSRNPPPTTSRQGPEWSRRYSLPFEESIEGEAQVHYGAELDRCHIISPNGGVKIGASRLDQCVVIEPCTIGDGVVAIAAILQGEIRDNCRIEAHADIQGTLRYNVTVGRGVSVETGALVGPGSTVGDMTVIHEGAEVGSDVSIGAQSDIAEHAYVADGLHLPARSVVREYVEVPADTRQGGAPEQGVAFQIVPLGEEPEQPETAYDDDGEPYDPEVWEPSALSIGQARAGDMARGQPRLIQRDYQSGSARSWVLSKLGRIANLKSSDGRLTKKLIQEWRPDLVEHPVTKEMLRIAPPITDEQLAELSYKALSGARYDVYGGISFHSGNTPDWQMLGPKANDVFTFAVPDSVVEETVQKLLLQKRAEPRSVLSWVGRIFGRASGGFVNQTFAEVLPNEDERSSPKKWQAYYYPGGYSDENQDPVYLDYYDDLNEAKRAAERAVLLADIATELPLPRLTWKKDGSEQALYDEEANLFGSVYFDDGDWRGRYFPGGYDANPEYYDREGPEYLPYGSGMTMEEAKRRLEEAIERSWKGGQAVRKRQIREHIDAAFSGAQGWHPDKGVRHAVGWVRLLVYPRQTVVVVEIQSDRSWMKFGWKEPPGPTLEAELRKLYFKGFADDVLNFVVEWAFNNRYGEVLVLDHASREALGGSPPKSFYDAAPKRYTISQPITLGEAAAPVRTYGWVPKDLKVRRIVPNRSR